MKRFIPLLSLAFLLASCGEGPIASSPSANASSESFSKEEPDITLITEVPTESEDSPSVASSEAPLPSSSVGSVDPADYKNVNFSLLAEDIPATEQNQYLIEQEATIKAKRFALDHVQRGTGSNDGTIQMASAPKGTAKIENLDPIEGLLFVTLVLKTFTDYSGISPVQVDATRAPSVYGLGETETLLPATLYKEEDKERTYVYPGSLDFNKLRIQNEDEKYVQYALSIAWHTR